MNKKTILFLTLGCLAQVCTNYAQEILRGRSLLSPRSQSVNAARELVGWYQFINLYDECFYGAATATPAYGQSFRPNRIAEYFFGSDQLFITGSQVANRGPNEILADYFGLSPEFQSVVCLNPNFKTFLVDFDVYLGYGSWYFRAHAPVVWTRWHFDMCETIIDDGSGTPFPALYMDTGITQPGATSFKEAMAGGVTYGQITEGLRFGKISPCALSTTKLSEIQWALGYNYFNDCRYHLGLNIRGSIPTGTTPNAEYLFEPIVGNGHHWELGVGITGHIILWEKDTDKSFGVYTDINMTHLFANHQCRSFDLCPNGFGSRYELVKTFDASGNYSGSTVPLINLTTFEAKVSFGFQLDAAIMFGFICNRWSFDLGYDAWLRTHEKVTPCIDIQSNRLGLKGIQNVATAMGPSNATQSTAKLTGNSFSNQAIVADPFPPVFIDPCDINPSSAENSLSFTNKIFSHLSYVFDPYYCGMQPFLGLGGFVEFEGLNPRNTTEPNHNSISQWQVWIKGGVGF